MNLFKTILANRCTGDEDQECLNFKNNKDLPEHLTSCDCGSSVKPIERIKKTPALIVVGIGLLAIVIGIYKFRSMVFIQKIIPSLGNPNPPEVVKSPIQPSVSSPSQRLVSPSSPSPQSLSESDSKLLKAEEKLAKLPKDKLLKFSIKTIDGNREVLGWLDASQKKPIVPLKAQALELWLKQYKAQSVTSEVISLIIVNSNKPSKTALLPNIQKAEFFNAVLDAVLNNQLADSSIDISQQEIDLYNGF